MRVFINGSHCDCERFPASLAFPKPLARGFTLQTEGFVDDAALRTDRTVRPKFGFKISVGRIFVMVVGCND
jgi:hypothetical protein